jgi:hypothetical protein
MHVQTSLPQTGLGVVVKAMNVCFLLDDNDFGGADSCTQYVPCCNRHFQFGHLPV